MPTRPKKSARPWIPVTSSGIANRERDPFYHTNAWRQASKAYLEDNPLCVECKKSGWLEPAKVTDHIIPKAVCRDPWDTKNWQPLCRACHSKKSARDKSHF